MRHKSQIVDIGTYALITSSIHVHGRLNLSIKFERCSIYRVSRFNGKVKNGSARDKKRGVKKYSSARVRFSAGGAA